MKYGQGFKDRAVARLLAPENASVKKLAEEVGVSVTTLERWQEEVLSRPVREVTWSAVSRLEAVIATAAMDEVQKNAWCRSQGLYGHDLAQWRQSATAALNAPEAERASPQQTRADQGRIKELERELTRKDKALAETAALLVLSKKLSAIFHQDVDA